MSIVVSLSVGESIISGTRSLHEVLEETHAEVGCVESNSLLKGAWGLSHRRQKAACAGSSLRCLSYLTHLPSVNLPSFV